MNNKLFKTLVVTSAGILACSLAFNSYAKSIVLNVWSFSDELKANGALATYEKAHPNVKVKLTIFPLENYLAKLKPALRNKKHAPDVFLGKPILSRN